MKVILLSGYRDTGQAEALGLQRTENGSRLIDWQIQQLSQLGLEVVCVVAGKDADQQLRFCPRIANTELVFDNSDQASLATNLKAGLGATEGEGCFIIPVEVLTPPAEVWRFLNQEWHRSKFHVDASVLQAIDAQGAPWHLGFPLLLTRKGNESLQQLANFHSLNDPRLNYLHVVYKGEPTLAPPPKAA